MKYPTSELPGRSAGSSRSITDAGGELDHSRVSHSLPPSPAAIPLSKRVAAEGVGTGLLLAAVVGSGIMGERLANRNIAIALLANTIAAGAAFIALILAPAEQGQTRYPVVSSRKDSLTSAGTCQMHSDPA